MEVTVTSIIKELSSSLVLRALVILFISWWVHWMWSRRKLYALSYSLPGPLALPILGNAIQLGVFGDQNGMVNRLKKMKLEYGDLFRIWLGPDLAMVISEAEDFEAVLTNKMTFWKGKKYDILKTVMHEGLLTASGSLWKRHRQVLNSSFSIMTQRSYQHIHDKHSKHIVEAMDKLCDKGLVEYTIVARRYAADILCESIFETEQHCYTGKMDELLNCIVLGALSVHERICKIWLFPDIIFKHSTAGKNLKYVINTYEKFVHDSLKAKIKEMIEIKSKNKAALQNNFTYEEDFSNEMTTTEFSDDKVNKSGLSVMVDALMAGNFTIEEILNEFNNISMPGLDTIYTQMSSFILLMGMNKDCQDKLWQEIKEVFHDDLDAEVKTYHFAQLPYLDMCFKETMRHFPTGPIQMRHVFEDFKLKSRDFIVPTGTTILLAPFLLHKNPKYWKDPEIFRPERFLPEESAKRPHFAYVPFSGGLRNCIGQIFGHDCLKTAIIYLIRNFEFHSDMKMKDMTYKADISMRCGTGYYAKITRRNRN